MQIYDEEEDDFECWLEDFNRRVCAQKHRNYSSCDDENSKECAIVDCTEEAVRGLFVTLRGQSQYKRYCRSHGYDQSQSERMYELGL